MMVRLKLEYCIQACNPSLIKAIYFIVSGEISVYFIVSGEMW